MESTSYGIYSLVVLYNKTNERASEALRASEFYYTKQR